MYFLNFRKKADFKVLFNNFSLIITESSTTQQNTYKLN